MSAIITNIIFSDAMVRALLREAAAPGTGKTQTRRLAKTNTKIGRGAGRRPARPSKWTKIKPGDLIWVREALTRSGGLIQYMADHKVTHKVWPPVWKDPLFARYLPRELNRITLVVTEVRRQLLWAITEEDARAEGAPDDHAMHWPDGDPGTISDVRRRNFATIWESLHGRGSWQEHRDTDVIALTFTVELRNIDAAGLA